MGEYFKAHGKIADRFCDPFDLRKGKFAGKHDPGKTLPIGPAHPFGIVDRELGRCMQDKAGDNLPGNGGEARVLDKDGIGPQRIQADKVSGSTGELPVVDQRVDRYVDPDSPCMINESFCVARILK